MFVTPVPLASSGLVQGEDELVGDLDEGQLLEVHLAGACELEQPVEPALEGAKAQQRGCSRLLRVTARRVLRERRDARPGAERGIGGHVRHAPSRS